MKFSPSSFVSIFRRKDCKELRAFAFFVPFAAKKTGCRVLEVTV